MTYGYDGNGHRQQIGGTWARTGLPQPLASATYDAANRVLTFGGPTLTYDLNGSLTSDGATTYTWDTRNRLRSLSGPSVTASFQYDAAGRRLGKTVNGTATTVLYNGLDAAQEATGTTVRNILTGAGLDEYLSHASTTGETRFALADALGSTIALVDGTGAVVTEYTYEPFGATGTTGAASENRAQYTGRENDGTGLYYYRARYYHPTLQRFLSEDPLLCGQAPLPVRSIKNNPQYLHTYAYVGNAPTLLRDPLGLSPECAYYDQRCGQVTSGIAKAYHCTAAKGVCENAPRGSYSNCVRQCLQDFDRDTCIPIFGRKDPTGLGVLACNLPSHAVCFQSCLPNPGPFPPP